jgi:Domain of unknown function (DUF4189)
MWGAIAYSGSTGRIGISSHHRDPASAKRAALVRCQVADAFIAIWDGYTWIALAVASNGLCGIGRGPSRDAAERAAKYDCQGNGGLDPQIRASLHTFYGRAVTSPPRPTTSPPRPTTSRPQMVIRPEVDYLLLTIWYLFLTGVFFATGVLLVRNHHVASALLIAFPLSGLVTFLSLRRACQGLSAFRETQRQKASHENVSGGRAAHSAQVQERHRLQATAQDRR